MTSEGEPIRVYPKEVLSKLDALSRLQGDACEWQRQLEIHEGVIYYQVKFENGTTIDRTFTGKNLERLWDRIESVRQDCYALGYGQEAEDRIAFTKEMARLKKIERERVIPPAFRKAFDER